MTGKVPEASARSRFLSGDPARVGEVREEIRKVVHGFHFSGAGVEEDLVQESLTRLVASLSEGRFRGESSLETYARSMAKYVCLEHRRRRRATADLDPASLASRATWPDPEESLLESEEHRRNLEAFAALPAECRELLLLINVHELSYREVGVRLGITEGAIKSRVRRMRAFILRRFAPSRDGARPVRQERRRATE